MTAPVKDPACRHSRELGYPVLPDEHDADQPCGEDCAGCARCPREHCVLGRCDNHTDAQHPLTCPKCVGRIRETIDRIVSLSERERLDAEAVNRPRDSSPGALRLSPMGGDAMTMIGPVSSGRAMLARALATGDYEDLEEAEVDSVSPLQYLASWEDCWRDWLGHNPGPRASVKGCADYLREHLTLMAQQLQRIDEEGDLEFAPPIEEFSRDMHRARIHLENRLGENVRPIIGVPCFQCGTDLRQGFDKLDACDHETPARAQLRAALTYPQWTVTAEQIRGAKLPCGCDQGGRRDTWRCPGCGQEYDTERYKRAKAEAMVDAKPLRTAPQIEALHGIRPATLRQWVARGHIAREYDEAGRPVYDIREVRRHAMRGGLIAS